MRKTVSTLLLLTLSALSMSQARTLAQAKADGTLHLYTSTDFAPFSSVIGNITSGGGKPVGFEVELGNLIAAKLGLKPVWQVKDFDTLLPAAQKNADVDLVIASHAITSTRLKVVDFTRPHYCTGGVALSGARGPQTSKSFKNQRVGAEAGSTYAGYLKKLPLPVNLKTFPNSEQSYQALLSGGVTAVVTDRFAALDAVKKYPDARWRVGPLLWREAIGMVVAKNNDALRLAVNGALAELMKDGSYARLSQKYFRQDIRC